MKTMETLDPEPFKHLIMTVGELPSSFVDSMSYYECLAWLVDYIQKNIIPAINNNADAIKAIQDWIETLDLQDEVNNKLNEMAEDGTLSYILTYVLPKSEYYFKTRFAYLSGTLAGYQGGCVLPDKSIIQFSGDSGLVYHIGTDGTVINANTLNIGHANSCCYCSKDQKVYVIQKHATDLTSGYVHRIDPATLELEETITVENYPDELYGIVYLEDEEKFCFINWWSRDNAVKAKMWKTNLDFEIVEQKNFDDIKLQTSSNFGLIGNYLGVEEISQHNVLLFDKNMNFVQQSKFSDLIGDTWCNTETEWFSTVDGVLYIGCLAGQSASPHRNGTMVVGECNLALDYEKTGGGSLGSITPTREVYYVNHNATNLLRDGSNNREFANIYEAINASLRTENVTGDVEIRIKNTPASDTYFKPIFTMNKKYYIVFQDTSVSTTEPIRFFNNLSIRGSDVTFNRGITFTPVDPKESPFTFATNAGDINLFGKLIINGIACNSDESAIKINGDERAYIKLGLNGDGIDVTDYWSELVNTRQQNTTVTGYKNDYYSFQLKGIVTPITANNGTYSVNRLTNIQFARIQFKFTDTSDAMIREIVIPVNYGGYQKIPLMYNDKFGVIVYESNTISMTGGTISRVILMSSN